ncbi:hypothetical protein H7J86_18535 [Mycobacterium hackensackense]|uniref:DUF732 domain-containing protein n=1 Tax=Mycobacterium hackensackense TaxID=228909 RepID=UPI002265C792|nr:DUF732 domain-containing protein [Mycobacterium hackensackense]MCV7254162.1 hypothetical protein [Mycobacterium hackensackense]
MSAPPGDETADYDEALPGAQTELAPSASETDAHTAWSLDDGPEWKPPFWSPGRITAVAAGASTALIATAAVVGFLYMRDRLDAVQVPAADATPTSTVALPPPPLPAPPPVTITTVVVQQAPKTITNVAPPPTWDRPTPPVVFPSKPPLAGPLPDLMPYNAEFLSNLRVYGWTIWNEAVMIQRGHETCAMMRDGEPRGLISQKLIGVEPQLTMQMAMQFTNIVTSAYPNCP